MPRCLFLEQLIVILQSSFDPAGIRPEQTADQHGYEWKRPLTRKRFDEA